MSDAVVMGFGFWSLAVCACLLLSAALGFSLWLVGILGAQLFKRLRRIYSMAVVGYWIDRFEKEGLATFEKASKDYRS